MAYLLDEDPALNPYQLEYLTHHQKVGPYEPKALQP